MKLKYELEIVNMGDEMIAVPVGENANQLHGVLKINKEGGEILELLKQGTSEKEIVECLAKKYENNIDNLQTLVHSFIERLQTYELLDY